LLTQVIVSAARADKELEAQTERLARAELRALRAQISPHFVYNALTAIASYIHSSPEEARELLSEFAELTRYAFRSQRPYATIADELGYVEKYLRLERARFGERLQVRLEVAPEVLPAVLPALTAAYKAGKVVVPYRVDVGGKAGQNYTLFIGSSFKDDGVSWGKWIKSILPDGGNLLFLSGPAGNSQGLDELAGLKSVLDDKYKFLNPAPFDVTNWDPSLTQQVLTAEIAKHDKIDVIVSDFGPSLVGALPVFKKFNRSIPALATSDGNSLGCFWVENHKDNPDFKLFTVATGNDNVRLAVDWAVAEVTGGKPPAEKIFKAPVFEDSVSGQPHPVQCRSDLPGAIYLSAKLAGDAQAKAVNR
jgi:hypothetical protein